MLVLELPEGREFSEEALQGYGVDVAVCDGDVGGIKGAIWVPLVICVGGHVALEVLDRFQVEEGYDVVRAQARFHTVVLE